MMSVVRISIGRFNSAKCDAIPKPLADSQKTLVPALRALKGTRSYCAGIDPENNAMTNVSVWDTPRRRTDGHASTEARSDPKFSLTDCWNELDHFRRCRAL